MAVFMQQQDGKVEQENNLELKSKKYVGGKYSVCIFVTLMDPKAEGIKKFASEGVLEVTKAMLQELA